MALPSSRLPPELEEEAAAKVQQAKRQKLVFRTSKVDIFKKTMADWYKNLSSKQKKRLTPKDLKRKAVNVCFANDMVYDNLPLDWVDELRAKYGLKLYQKKQQTHDQSSFGDAPRPGTSTDASSSVDQADVSKRKATRYSESSSSSANATEKVVPTPKPSASKGKGTTKRFLDLSNDPPPPYWLKAYAEGTVLPRVLLVHSTEDTNILYYDYCPKLKDSLGREVRLQPQPRINLNALNQLGWLTKDSD